MGNGFAAYLGDGEVTYLGDRGGDEARVMV